MVCVTEVGRTFVFYSAEGRNKIALCRSKPYITRLPTTHPGVDQGKIMDHDLIQENGMRGCFLTATEGLCSTQSKVDMRFILCPGTRPVLLAVSMS